MRVVELEDRLTDKEEVLDKVRWDYNDLMEKYMKQPKKVTTTSTTIKTEVETDPNASEDSKKAIEEDASKALTKVKGIMTDEALNPRDPN